MSVVTFLGVVHPWMCDQMGHLNVRHYAAMFDDASFQFLGRICPSEVNREAGLGWADVRCEIDYKHETPVGTLLTITSEVVRVGKKSITYRHTMADNSGGAVHAVAQITTVRFDLSARKGVDLDAAALANLAKLGGPGSQNAFD